MHHLSPDSRRHSSISTRFQGCQAQVRFFALLRIKPHTPLLVRAPVNSFEFQRAGRSQVGLLIVLTHGTGGRCLHYLVSIVLQCGLPGGIVILLPTLFAPQRQLSSKPPRHWCSSIYAFHRH